MSEARLSSELNSSAFCVRSSGRITSSRLCSYCCSASTLLHLHLCVLWCLSSSRPVVVRVPLDSWSALPARRMTLSVLRFLPNSSSSWRHLTLVGRPLVRIRPRHFHEPRLVHLLVLSTRTERAILLREELSIWEAFWGSVSFNHRVLLFSSQQTWLCVALGNGELHRCMATALFLGP